MRLTPIFVFFSVLFVVGFEVVLAVADPAFPLVFAGVLLRLLPPREAGLAVEVSAVGDVKFVVGDEV